MKWSIHATAITTVGSLTLALATWTTMAAGRIYWPLLLASVLLWCLSGYLGVCILSRLAAQEDAIDPVVATVLGFYCVNVILGIGTVILRLDVLVSLSFCIVLLGWLAYKTRKRQPLHRLKLEPVGVFGLLVAIVFATLWSRQNLAGLVLAPTTVTSTPWLDTFYHSIHIAHFARGAGKLLGTDPLLSAASLPPYHYAAYVVPSLLVRATGISSYVAAAALFAPLGTLLTGLSAYSFGRIVIGPLAGLLAIVLCLVVPDPTFYLLDNRWISYFFLQQIAGNGAFGTALMLMAWAFCIEGVTKQLRRYTFLGLFAGLFVAFFKSQLFLAYSFGLLLFAAATFPRLAIRLRIVLGILVSAVFAVCAFIVLPAIPRAPTFLPGMSAGITNLQGILGKLGGSCSNCVIELSKNYLLFLAAAIPAFLALTFGILALLCPLLVSSRAVRKALPPGGMWFFWTALIGYLFVTLGFRLNLSYGDRYEVIHKTFVWPYLALSTWCGCALATWLLARGEWLRRAVLTLLLQIRLRASGDKPGWGQGGPRTGPECTDVLEDRKRRPDAARGPDRRPSVNRRIEPVMLTTVLPITLIALGFDVNHCANALQTGFVYPGSDKATHISLSRNAFDAAAFIRETTPGNAVVQTGAVDGSLMFQSLMERRTYVAQGLSWRYTPALANPARANVAAMLGAPTPEEFRAQAREYHIDYFVLYPGQQPAWASTLRPIFQSGEYRVFRLS